jgi:hypothetical protein
MSKGEGKKMCAHTIYKVSLQVNVVSLHARKKAWPAMAQILNSISYIKFPLIRQIWRVEVEIRLHPQGKCDFHGVDFHENHIQ